MNKLAEALVNMLTEALVNMLAEALVNVLAEVLVNMLAEALMNILAESLMNIHVFESLVNKLAWSRVKSWLNFCVFLVYKLRKFMEIYL